MVSMNWKEFLSEVIVTFRKEFEKLSPEEQKIIREKAFHNSLLEPCQIEVLDAGTEKSAVWFVIHDNNLTDMTFIVHMNVKNPDVGEFWRKYKFSPVNKSSIKTTLSSSYAFHEIVMQQHLFHISRDAQSQEIAEWLLHVQRNSAVRKEQVDAIRSSTEGLRKSIAKIPEENVRNELLAVTKKIDGALGEIKRIDEDVGKVRQLVGVTKEIQDWRLLVSDVDRLREEHVPREVFDTHIKRIDEKIDKGLQALSTRVEDLKAIKFWSKRTIIDIILIIATFSTTIATLLVTGLLKF